MPLDRHPVAARFIQELYDNENEHESPSITTVITLEEYLEALTSALDDAIDTLNMHRLPDPQPRVFGTYAAIDAAELEQLLIRLNKVAALS